MAWLFTQGDAGWSTYYMGMKRTNFLLDATDAMW